MWPLMDIVAKRVDSKWFQFFRWSRFKNISSFSLTIYEKNPCPDQFTRFFSKWLIIHQLGGSYGQWLSGLYWLKFILFYLLIILCKTAHFLCTSLDQFSGVLPLMSSLFSHQCYTGQKYVSNTVLHPCWTYVLLFTVQSGLLLISDWFTEILAAIQVLATVWRQRPCDSYDTSQCIQISTRKGECIYSDCCRFRPPP